MSELKVTDINDIVNATKPRIVELPPFPDGTPFVAKLRRPSMLMLMKSGKIPNKLVASAAGIFPGGKKKSADKDEVNYAEIIPMMTAVCEASLVEPSMALLKENDVELTDQQINAIFAYSQKGLDGLEQFRNVPEDPDDN